MVFESESRLVRVEDDCFARCSLTNVSVPPSIGFLIHDNLPRAADGATESQPQT
jgi:hypothetical protein